MKQNNAMDGDKPAVDASDQPDETDLATLVAAKQLAKTRLLENPTPANLSAFSRASKLVELAGEKGDDAGARRFKSRAAALRHLQEKGYKIKKTKFYREVDEGLCHMQPDGSIMETALFRYINHPKAGLIPREAVEDLNESDQENFRRKTELQAERLEISIARERFNFEKEQGLHIPRSDLEMEIVARAVALRALLKNWIHFRADFWVQISARHQLVEDMESGLEALMNEFADTKRFHVIFDHDTANS